MLIHLFVHPDDGRNEILTFLGSPGFTETAVLSGYKDAGAALRWPYHPSKLLRQLEGNKPAQR